MKFSLNFIIITSLILCLPLLPATTTTKIAKQKRLKVLFALQIFPEDVSTAVLNQMTGLIDRGVDLDIYAKRKGNLFIAHTDVHKYKLLNRTFFKSGKCQPDFKKYDIICCQYGYTGFALASIIKNNNIKAKFLTFFRGADISKDMERKLNKYKELFIVGDHFLPVCDYFKKILIELGCPEEKIIVHHSAIDCNKFCYRKRTFQPDGPIRVVTVGRFVEKKGIEHSIKAIASLLPQFPTIEYNIVGFGPLENELTSLIKTLGVSKNIRIVGHATQDEVATLLKNSHIFILASTTATNGDQEGIPNVIKEAMAIGLPIVSTFHAGIPELVENGVSGLLVHENDIPALAESVTYLIKHPKVWKEMGMAGRKKIEQEYETNKLNDHLFKFLMSLTQ